ncbi:MAG: hypothetical protein JWP01_2559 [Myxococcales bacterium]|nr:hypothetical protein [Myxococcales bacterium]
MYRALVLTALVIAGCKKQQDDCQRFVDKSRTYLLGMKGPGKKLTDAHLEQVVETCRKSKGDPANKDDALMKCVLDAQGDAAIETCWSASFSDFASGSKRVEAVVELKRMARSIEVLFDDMHEFPKGTAGPTPARDCCKGPGNKCTVWESDWAADTLWARLYFAMIEPNQFRYTYESDGATVTATATGDLDCDGTAITYTMKMSIENGRPKMTITEPDATAD